MPVPFQLEREARKKNPLKIHFIIIDSTFFSIQLLFQIPVFLFSPDAGLRRCLKYLRYIPIWNIKYKDWRLKLQIYCSNTFRINTKSVRMRSIYKRICMFLANHSLGDFIFLLHIFFHHLLAQCDPCPDRKNVKRFIDKIKLHKME